MLIGLYRSSKNADTAEDVTYQKTSDTAGVSV